MYESIERMSSTSANASATFLKEHEIRTLSNVAGSSNRGFTCCISLIGGKIIMLL